MLPPPACLNGVYPAETTLPWQAATTVCTARNAPAPCSRRDKKRDNRITFLIFFDAIILLRPQAFFLWSFWRWFAIWTIRGFLRIVRPANRRPGASLPDLPWSPRCTTGVLSRGAALPPDMPPHARIFALVQVFFRICLFFQHVHQYPATDLFHLHAAGL